MADSSLVLPQDWKVTPLEELASFETGRTPSRSVPRYWETEDNGGVTWISIADMSPYGTIQTTRERITAAALKETFRGRFSRKGTLLMSFKLTIGRLSTLGVDACHNEAIISIFPNGRVNQKYLEYFLSQVNYADYQDRAVKGQTLNQEKINRIQVAEPPKHEQEKIATLLWKVQRAIEVEEKLIATACELKQAAMRQLFSRGLRGEEQQETEIGLMPESWHMVKLGDVCSLSTGTTPSTKNPSYYNGEVPFIKTFEVVNNRITNASNFVSREAVSDYNLRIYPPGTVLMAMYGQGKTRGQVSLLEVSTATTQNAAAIEPDDRISGEFLWQYLLSIYDRLRGLGSLGHLSHLNLGYMRELAVICPPRGEQDEIVVILNAIDNKISLHARKRASMQELFQTLLHKLMTGEIRVADLDIDVSEVTQ